MGERVEAEEMEAFVERRAAQLQSMLRQRGQKGTLERLSKARRRRRVRTFEPRARPAQDAKDDAAAAAGGDAGNAAEEAEFRDDGNASEDFEDDADTDDAANWPRMRGDSDFTVDTVQSASTLAQRNLVALNDEIWRLVGKFFGRSEASTGGGTSSRGVFRRLSIGRRERSESTSSRASRRRDRPRPSKYATMRPHLKISGGTRRDFVVQEHSGEVQQQFEAYLQGSRPNIWYKVEVCIFPTGLGIFARPSDIPGRDSVVDLFFDKLVLPTGNPVDIMQMELSKTRFAYAMHTEHDTFILAAASKPLREDHVDLIQSAYEEYIETEIRHRAMMQITWQISSEDPQSFLKATRKGPLLDEMRQALIDKFDEDMRHLVHQRIMRKALITWSAIARHKRARRTR